MTSQLDELNLSDMNWCKNTIEALRQRVEYLEGVHKYYKRGHHPRCDLLEAAGFESMGNKCTCLECIEQDLKQQGEPVGYVRKYALEHLKNTQAHTVIDAAPRTDDDIVLYTGGYEQGKKDGWEACETCHGIIDGKIPYSAPTIPEGQKVTADTEGVRFGKGCWMSHEAITGCSAEQLNAGICGVLGKQYMEWVQAMLLIALKGEAQ